MKRKIYFYLAGSGHTCAEKKHTNAAMLELYLTLIEIAGLNEKQRYFYFYN